MKTQIVVMHGGECFKSYPKYISFLKKWRIDFGRYLKGKKDWKRNLGTALGKKYEVILPDMPNKMNAKYLEWKIWFEKFVPHLRKDAVLVGHSLGGLFLIKYLSENIFPKKLRAIMLVSAPLSEGDFKLRKNLDKITKQCGRVFFYHSKDDKVVPFRAFFTYQKMLKNTVGRVFESRGHFNQANFPEIVRDIKELF